jgi:hypothetical protein
MHANEVRGKNGQTWYGLFHTKDGFKLLKTTVSIHSVPNPEQELYDKVVKTDLSPEPVFLIRGLSDLQEGPINTVFAGFFYPTPSKNLALQLSADLASQYNLYCSGIDTAELIKNYKLEFYHHPEKQTLLTRDPAHIDALPNLRWAGDLDRDGKMDLLVDLTDHYNVSELTLFLSSRAAPNELVKPVASFRKVCC